jgi:ISXO2-like transposase domain/Transposase zinc-ribbon domain
MGQVQFTQQMTVPEFDRLFPTDEACKAYLVARRWPDGVRCPRCGNERVTAVSTRPFHWQCTKCAKAGGYRFSVLVDTIFENTNVPMRQWFKVIYLVLVSKKGVAALQVQRMMGFGSYTTAHYMCHRIRAALIDPDFRKLMGIVEVDEIYVGGKNKNRHWDKKTPGTGGAGKEIVIGAVERQGTVVARVLREANTRTMGNFVRSVVSDRVSLIATDEHSGYLGLGPKLPHDSVRHGRGEYVRGLVHTQTIDSFWSLLKRSIMGSFHHVSAKYLPLYVAEFEWRYNNRKNPDIFSDAVAAC